MEGKGKRRVKRRGGGKCPIELNLGYVYRDVYATEDRNNSTTVHFHWTLGGMDAPAHNQAKLGI